MSEYSAEDWKSLAMENERSVHHWIAKFDALHAKYVALQTGSTARKRDFLTAPIDDAGYVYFGDAATAIASKERGAALEEAAEDERDRLMSLAFDQSISTHSYRQKSWAEAAKCWLKDNGAMYPIERARLRSLAEASDRAPRDGETEQEERV